MKNLFTIWNYSYCSNVNEKVLEQTDFNLRKVAFMRLGLPKFALMGPNYDLSLNSEACFYS